MRIKHIAIVAALAGSMLAPVGASAYEGCNTDIVVFSHPGGHNAFQVGLCAAAEEDMRSLGFDPRLISPGSHSVQVRYTQDINDSTPTITATLNGLGFTDHVITLRRIQTSLGSFVYDSNVVSLPNGRMSSGCLAINVPAVERSTAFHTVDSSCEA